MLKFGNHLLDIAYLVMYFVFIGLLIPISLVSCIWKSLVFGIVKLFYSKSLSPTFGFWEYLFMRNDPKIVSKPDKVFYILGTLTGNQCCVKELKSNFTKNVLNEFNPDGTFKYERLRQYPKKFGGYYVFELCNKFDINKHIKVCSENVNERNLGQFLAKQSELPFEVGSPPWNILIIPNYNGENRTLLYWRIHHVLCDGLSIVRLMLSRTFVGGNLEQDLAKLEQCPLIRPKLKDLTPRALYMKTIGWPRFFANNAVRDTQALCNNFKNSNYFVCSTNKIPLELFKRFKKMENRPMTTVLMATISFALQSYIQNESKFNNSDLFKVFTILPVRRNGRDEPLSNNFGMAGIQVPVNQSASTVHTIHSMMDYVTGELEKIKEASGSPFEILLYKLLYTLPYPISKWISLSTGGVLISNMVCSSEATTVYGIPLEDIQFWIKSSRFPSISFNVLSYNGYIRVSLMSCSTVVPNEDTLKKLCETIERSLLSLLTTPNWDPNIV